MLRTLVVIEYLDDPIVALHGIHPVHFRKDPNQTCSFSWERFKRIEWISKIEKQRKNCDQSERGVAALQNFLTYSRCEKGAQDVRDARAFQEIQVDTV